MDEETSELLREIAAARAGLANELHGERFDRERAVEVVRERAREVYGEPAATEWLYSANQHLDGARPIDVTMLRGTDEVLDLLGF